MSTLTKMAIAAFAGLLLGGGAFAMAQTSDTGTVTETTTVEQPGDVSGPCDEAEHANDPRCDGPQRPEDNGNDDANDDNGVDDISGPCDEAEHANDPRCTGAGGAVREDNSGPGSANSGHGNSHDDDSDEDNSGPGNSHDVGDDHGGDDSDDDSSGSGHSGSDSSGSGSSGSGSSHSGGSDDD